MQVAWLILADAAEVLGGKLYLMGGGWDTLNVTEEFPHSRTIALALAISVPWNETNQKQEIQIEIGDQDGATVLASGFAGFEVGRPPGRPAGQSQLIQFALSFGIKIPHPGTYAVRVRGNAVQEARHEFNVVAGPRLGMARPA